MLGNLGVAERLAASKEGLRSLGLVSYLVHVPLNNDLPKTCKVNRIINNGFPSTRENRLSLLFSMSFTN
jgi:hypothetical protein